MSAGTVVVTGFGPFGDHKINASWESVKLLPEEIDGYSVIKEEIPVSYDHVDEKVRLLWENHKPQLVIHVGVSSYTNKVTLETRAHKEGYLRKDVFGKNLTVADQCAPGTCLQVGIDVNNICEELNCQSITEACTSDDAGRYLCEYILYTSLSIKKDKALFIHVPPLGKPYSEQELANAIVHIIRCALKQNKR